MGRGSASKPKKKSDGWRLPGTGLLWALPLVIPWLGLSGGIFDLPPHTHKTLGAGTAGIALVLAIGLWAARRTRHAARSPARRVVLWAFLAGASALGIVTLAAGSFGPQSSYLAIAPWLTWILCTFLIPYWRDDDAIDAREPETGWKRLFGMRLIYCNPADEALWVRMRTRFRISLDIGYAPNLGHMWGRLALGMGFVLLALSMTVVVMSG